MAVGTLFGDVTKLETQSLVELIIAEKRYTLMEEGSSDEKH
jgi:hypothetical protein